MRSDPHCDSVCLLSSANFSFLTGLSLVAHQSTLVEGDSLGSKGPLKVLGLPTLMSLVGSDKSTLPSLFRVLLDGQLLISTHID